MGKKEHSVLGCTEFGDKLETAAKDTAGKTSTGPTIQMLHATLRDLDFILPIMGNRDRFYEKELVT